MTAERYGYNVADAERWRRHLTPAAVNRRKVFMSREYVQALGLPLDLATVAKRLTYSTQPPRGTWEPRLNDYGVHHCKRWDGPPELNAPNERPRSRHNVANYLPPFRRSTSTTRRFRAFIANVSGVAPF